MTDEDPLLISGYAAYRHAPPPPHVQRRVAACATYEARMTTGAAREPAFRRALELHVDAFLLDRRGNADSFAQAHRIGRELVAEFSCPLAQDEHRHWVNRCGVLALHNRIGASPGGTVRDRVLDLRCRAV